MAVLTQVVLTLVFHGLIVIGFILFRIDLFGIYGLDQTISTTALMTLLCLLAVGAAARSLGVYTRMDRLRAWPGFVLAQRESHPGLFAQLNLAAWQARWFALGMALFGLVGLAALTFIGIPAWPALTVIIGVLSGVTASIASRTSNGASDPQFPTTSFGKTWLLHCCVRFAIGVGSATVATLVVIVPTVVKVDSSAPQAFVSQDQLGVTLACDLLIHPLRFLSLWLVYGFAAGSLCGLSFRRSIAAVTIALGMGFVLGGLWVPTIFIGGGDDDWRIWAVPAVMLIGSWLLTQNWWITSHSSLRRFGVIAVSAMVFLFLIADGLSRRATEMPVDPNAVDVDAVLAKLPTAAENPGGIKTADALRKLAQLSRTSIAIDSAPQLRPPEQTLRQERRFFDLAFLAQVVTTEGWNNNDEALRQFLSVVVAEKWAQTLSEAADLPPGPITNPRDNPPQSLSSLDPSFGATAAVILAARGLQQQADGSPETFVDNLRTTLALSRNLGRDGLVGSLIFNRSVEHLTMQACEHWLERLRGHPELLRKALSELRQHLQSPPFIPEEAFQIQFVSAVQRYADPANVARLGNGADPFFPLAPADTNVMRILWQVPWEKTRLRRSLDGLVSSDPKIYARVKDLAAPFVKETFAANANNLNFFYTRLRNPWRDCEMRAAELQLALRLFAEDHGRTAEKLSELVPEYLPSVPLDACDGKPFRYRISKGEALDWPHSVGTNSEMVRQVPPGQGILWSVGLDGHDEGGHLQGGFGASVFGGWGGGDWIFLVPLPPEQP
jgi:hypothetical protein